jgi:hypothetical protein
MNDTLRLVIARSPAAAIDVVAGVLTPDLNVVRGTAFAGIARRRSSTVVERAATIVSRWRTTVVVVERATLRTGAVAFVVVARTGVVVETLARAEGISLGAAIVETTAEFAPVLASPIVERAPWWAIVEVVAVAERIASTATAAVAETSTTATAVPVAEATAAAVAETSATATAVAIAEAIAAATAKATAVATAEAFASIFEATATATASVIESAAEVTAATTAVPALESRRTIVEPIERLTSIVVEAATAAAATTATFVSTTAASTAVAEAIVRAPVVESASELLSSIVPVSALKSRRPVVSSPFVSTAIIAAFKPWRPVVSSFVRSTASSPVVSPLASERIAAAATATAIVVARRSVVERSSSRGRFRGRNFGRVDRHFLRRWFRRFRQAQQSSNAIRRQFLGRKIGELVGIVDVIQHQQNAKQIR